ncbi:MAG: MoxR family ATPase [Elusimicrobiota bacterium]|nr:MoxR family ATPase [Endomicrobiia bacterium]MDW8165557.1 MoxR family ATPase [Elusimicrobiota bacterium]
MKKTDQEYVKEIIDKFNLIIKEIGKKIVGQKQVIKQLLISLLSKGHCLIVGVPGLAKTMIVHTIADVMDLKFNRIQFTPDLMPSDITGTEVIEEDPITKKRNYRFIPGPIFANIILADEINRTPPKTQSALLQAMQEYKVTVNGVTYELPLPFIVLATQNPIEQEGTYPLPEAQLDRFFFQINIDYPSKDEEKEILFKTTGTYEAEVKKIVTKEEILEFQNFVRKVPISEYVIDYIIEVVRSTRPKHDSKFDFVKKYVEWGCGPRAEQTLVIASKVNTLLNGSYSVSIEDVNEIVLPALRHRIILNYRAIAEGYTTDSIISQIIENLKDRYK